MTPNTVTYTRRLPAEQYGYMEMTATATIGDDENAHEAFMSLKEEVERAITAQAMETTTVASEKEETPEPKKKAAKKSKPVEEEEITVEDTPEEEEEVVAPKAAKASKKFKSKATAYSRSSDTHKAMFASLLAEVAPNWKSSESSKAKAKSLSQSLDGQDFLDENGETLMSFITAVKKGMK